MRLAILADIHANLHALDAVLADIERRGMDRVIVNGDLVNRGPNNVAVVERLAARDDVWTLGNHDDLMRKWHDRDRDIPREWFGDPFWDGTAWSAAQLARAGWLNRLRALPMTHRIEVPGAPTLLISHGSPRHYREGYGRLLSDEHVGEIVAAFPADILIGSHTHWPLERRVGPTTLLNTGAVGAPFNGDPRAQYLALTLRGNEWGWDFHAVPYDRDAALRAFHELAYLAEGGLSARIFYEELRYARPLYAPFWLWAETRKVPMTWDAWATFGAEQLAGLVVPE